MLFKTVPLVITDNDQPCADVIGLIESGLFEIHNTAMGLSDKTYYLDFIDNALTLHLKTTEESLDLSIDFTAGKSKHRRLYGGGKNQPLPKACGLYKHPEWHIFDATAGLGRDAFVLASLGASVTLCEQNAALYALLVDAKSRGMDNPDTQHFVSNMDCLFRDAVDYLPALIDNKPDVIYLDPMYPERKKSAKIKKEMQVLQQLVGHADDQTVLLDVALQTAKHRVVVKRSKSAKSLSDTAPSYTVSSENTRYDVYSL
ncbi:MAG: 16S rRNA (guanine1516-N2)-methyltransferase [Cycloclasticus sp.]